MNTDNIITIFCEVDDFCLEFEPEFNKKLIEDGTKKRNRESTLCLSEVMTITICFHSSAYRTFKDYYTQEVEKHLRWAFPRLVSYNRFVELMSDALVPLCCYLHTIKGKCSGISFIDSTKITVCHNRRIHSHKVFIHWASRGKTTTGWFYGFKLHFIVNDEGELLAFHFTPGNVDDREPPPNMVRGMFGKLFGDKGYISKQLFELLYGQGIQLITKLRKNMKNKLMSLVDKILLRKRAIVETIIDQLKNISQLEHTRHRSPVNFMVNAVCSLIAYSHKEKKPSLNIRSNELGNLPVVM
jgi:hypothetical protein